MNESEKMAVEITANYIGTLGVSAKHGPSGAALTTDAPLDNGGKGESFSPTDLVATAFASCVLTILALVGERHDLDLKDATAVTSKVMIAAPVRRIASLKTTVTIPAGRVEDLEMRKRIEAAALKCPVHQSIHPEIDASIEFVYQ